MLHEAGMTAKAKLHCSTDDANEGPFWAVLPALQNALSAHFCRSCRAAHPVLRAFSK